MTEYYIDAKTYLPDFLQDNAVMNEVVDCLNSLISTKLPTFQKIYETYHDTLYRNRDYSKLSYLAKIEIIKELGFEYLINMLDLSSEQLSQLLMFFNLIYMLKGKKEGLQICLNTLGLVYQYTAWDESIPIGRRFTAKLKIIGNEFLDYQLFKKLKTFVRAYMLPYIFIEIEAVFEAPPMYIYPTWGALTRLKYEQDNEITRSGAEIAVYDESMYDNDKKFGAKIFQGPDEDNPQVMPFYTLTIVPDPIDSNVVIRGENTRTLTVEHGILFDYTVSCENCKTKHGLMVLNEDTVLEVKLKKGKDYIENCTFTILPNPNYAKVELIAEGYEQHGNMITVAEGTVVQYRISADGYEPVEGYRTIIAKTVLEITLEKSIPQCTIKIETHTPDAVIRFYSLTGEPIETDTVVVQQGTPVTYEVSAEGYVTQKETIIAEQSQTIVVDLIPERKEFTLTIQTVPSDATVVLSADGYEQQGNSITVLRGTVVTYSAEAPSCSLQTGIKQVMKDTTLTLVLNEFDYNAYFVEGSDVTNIATLGFVENVNVDKVYSKSSQYYILNGKLCYYVEGVLHIVDDEEEWTHVTNETPESALADFVGYGICGGKLYKVVNGTTTLMDESGVWSNISGVSGKKYERVGSSMTVSAQYVAYGVKDGYLQLIDDNKITQISNTQGWTDISFNGSYAKNADTCAMLTTTLHTCYAICNGSLYELYKNKATKIGTADKWTQVSGTYSYYNYITQSLKTEKSDCGYAYGICDGQLYRLGDGRATQVSELANWTDITGRYFDRRSESIYNGVEGEVIQYAYGVDGGTLYKIANTEITMINETNLVDNVAGNYAKGLEAQYPTIRMQDKAYTINDETVIPIEIEGNVIEVFSTNFPMNLHTNYTGASLIIVDTNLEFTITINPTPSDATVKLTADGFTQVGNSITVPKKTSVSYSVTKSNYYEIKGDLIATKNETLDLVLEKIPIVPATLSGNSGTKQGATITFVYDFGAPTNLTYYDFAWVAHGGNGANVNTYIQCSSDNKNWITLYKWYYELAPISFYTPYMRNHSFEMDGYYRYYRIHSVNSFGTQFTMADMKYTLKGNKYTS